VDGHSASGGGHSFQEHFQQLYLKRESTANSGRIESLLMRPGPLSKAGPFKEEVGQSD
jgi:hypothetical protein